jgi:hypothetical protein
MLLKWLRKIDWLPIIFVVLITGIPVFGMYASVTILIKKNIFFLSSVSGLLILSPVFIFLWKRLIEDYNQIPKSYYRAEWLKIEAFRDFITQLPWFFGLNLLVVIWVCFTFGITLPTIAHHIISKPSEKQWQIQSKNITHTKYTVYWLRIESSTGYISNSLRCDSKLFNAINIGDIVNVHGQLSPVGFSYSDIEIYSTADQAIH